MNNSPILKIKKAMKICKEAHDSIGQKRKYTNDPYWIHPFNVMGLLSLCTSECDILCAALLHDVIEDVWPTNSVYSLEFIKKEFGLTVAQMVDELTDKTTLSDGNRKERKSLERKRLKTVLFDTRMIKIADNIDNISTIEKFDPAFYKIYREEMVLSFPIFIMQGTVITRAENKEDDFTSLAAYLHALLYSRVSE